MQYHCSKVAAHGTLQLTTNRVTAHEPALRLRHEQGCPACRFDCSKDGNGPEVDAAFGLAPPPALALRQLYMLCSASGSSKKYPSLTVFLKHVATKPAWKLLSRGLSARHVAMALRLHLKVGSTFSYGCHSQSLGGCFGRSCQQV